MTFDAARPSTWPLLMTVDQIAAIFARKVGGIRKSCQQRTFYPAPVRKPNGTVITPYRWRKSEVERVVLASSV